MSRAATTERVRRVWDQQAERFDRQMSLWERILFPGDREWACSRASGDVLCTFSLCSIPDAQARCMR